MTASPRNFIDRMFFGFQNTATLKVALELDVFTAIGNGALDADALAAKCDAATSSVGTEWNVSVSRDNFHASRVDGLLQAAFFHNRHVLLC